MQIYRRSTRAQQTYVPDLHDSRVGLDARRARRDARITTAKLAGY